MFIGTVQCEVELSKAHRAFDGFRFLLVEPEHEVEWEGAVVAVDTVSAQVGDMVVVALAPLGSAFDIPEDLPVDGAVVGIVGSVTTPAEEEEKGEEEAREVYKPRLEGRQGWDRPRRLQSRRGRGFEDRGLVGRSASERGLHEREGRPGRPEDRGRPPVEAPPVRRERIEAPERTAERGERADRPGGEPRERGSRPEQRERIERPERGEGRPGPAEGPPDAGRTDRGDRGRRPERGPVPERAERPERGGFPESPGRPGRGERGPKEAVFGARRERESTTGPAIFWEEEALAPTPAKPARDEPVSPAGPSMEKQEAPPPPAPPPRPEPAASGGLDIVWDTNEAGARPPSQEGGAGIKRRPSRRRRR